MIHRRLMATPREEAPVEHGRRRFGRLAGLAVAGLGAGLFQAHASAEPPGDARQAVDPQQDDQAIRALIERMQAAWNRGDFLGYMAGFRNPDVIFVSKGRIKTGWQDTLDHYIRDYGAPGRRGVLRFSDIRIELLAPDAAQLISHYRLERATETRDGVNTRLMRKVQGRWVIALNHVSYKEDAPPGACPGSAQTG